MRTCPTHAFAGHMTVDLRETFTSLTPLAGILTFSWAADITRRGRALQQRVRWRALERRDPSTIIPNHPPHAALAARTPSASAHSLCSFAACAGCVSMDGGRWTSSTAQGHLHSFWGREPSRGPCWRGGRGHLQQARRTFSGSALRSSRSGPSGRGLGGWDRVRTGRCPLLYTYFRVSELVFTVLERIPTLRHGARGSEEDVAPRGGVDIRRLLRHRHPQFQPPRQLLPRR